VLAGLSSDDPVAKLGAKTCKLNSNDPVVRGVVIQQLLVGLPIMSFDVNSEPKDTVGAQVIERMPQFGIQETNWNKDGRSFSGQGVPGGPQFIYGHFLGVGLSVTFTGVPVQPVKSGDPPVATDCSARLTMPQGGTQLEGQMHCTGLAFRPQSKGRR
jgi:hypothetical protein